MAVHGTGGQLTTRTLTTIENYRKGPLVDQVTQGIGIWRYMSERNLVEYKKLVGREEIIPLDVASDSNGQDFDDLDVMTVGPTNELKECRVGAYNYRTGFYIGDIESMENEGNAKNLSLLKVRMDAMAKQAKVDMAKRIVGSQGSNTKRGEGLRDIMGGAVVAADETPVSSTTFSNTSTFGSLHGLACGDIDGEDFANLWGPVYKRITTLGNNNGNIEDLHIRGWMELRKWGGDPSVGICDQAFYQYYAKMRGAAASASLVTTANAYPTPIPGDKPGGRVTKFSPGLPDLFWNGKPIIFDPYVTIPSTFSTSGGDAHCNWITADNFKIVIDPRANWKTLNPRERAGNDKQYVDIYQMWIRYRLECNKRNAHFLAVIDL